MDRRRRPAAICARRLVGTALEKGCRGVLSRGGIVAASGPAAALLAKAPVEGKAKGCDLLPDAVVEIEAKASKLSAALKANPGRVGYSVGPGAALVVRGRRLAGMGSGKVSAVLGATATREERRVPLGGKRIEDLTLLRRAARDRADGFPPAKVGKPVVAKGTLVIIGGGGMPKGHAREVRRTRGGQGGEDRRPADGHARTRSRPTGSPMPPTRPAAKKVTTLPDRTLAGVEGKESLAAAQKATSIWFGGGRQWQFMDAYENTRAVPLMFDVLARGGVIGGTCSAGATIQGEYLTRGGVFENFLPMVEGYERGLAFLPGVAIDQHFGQRKLLRAT